MFSLCFARSGPIQGVRALPWDYAAKSHLGTTFPTILLDTLTNGSNCFVRVCLFADRKKFMICFSRAASEDVHER